MFLLSDVRLHDRHDCGSHLCTWGTIGWVCWKWINFCQVCTWNALESWTPHDKFLLFRSLQALVALNEFAISVRSPCYAPPVFFPPRPDNTLYLEPGTKFLKEFYSGQITDWLTESNALFGSSLNGYLVFCVYIRLYANIAPGKEKEENILMFGDVFGQDVCVSDVTTSNIGSKDISDTSHLFSWKHVQVPR